METISDCPVCGNNIFDPFLICNDYLVSNQKFAIQQCQQCNLRFTNPRPNSDSLATYYKSEQYVSHNDKSSGLINSIYRLVRTYTLQSKLNLIRKLNASKGTILDVGCGTASFLEKCKKDGWQVTGVEPDEEARTIATEKIQVEIKPDLQAIAQDQQFDIITLWHVLEHVPDVNDTISQLQTLLNKQGTLIVAVPNSDSYDAHYFEQYWAAYDVPRHLYHFTPQTIEYLFEKNGFKLINKQPMLFDAFYIAMLSTRYKNGESDYLKSIQIGLTSNHRAKQTGHFSSLIYSFNKAS